MQYNPQKQYPVFIAAAGDYPEFVSFNAELSEEGLHIRPIRLMGGKCIVPALVYLFNLIEKKFDGRLSMLVLDEAWVFLKNETFADKIAEWLFDSFDPKGL